MVSLHLLGGLTLEGLDGPLTGPAAQRKRLALVALLAMAPSHRLSRDRIAAYLWPESEADRARHQLSSGLHFVRKAAGEASILAVGGELQLDPAIIRVDAIEFQANIERGADATAVALYKGPFLDGFHLRDASDFEHWADRERDGLARAYGQALERLAEASEASGNLSAAADWWRARAEHDGYDARVTLRLMQALDAAGNRVGAVQHADAHARLLREEFGMEPAPAVVDLAARLRAEPAPNRGSGTGDQATVHASGSVAPLRPPAAPVAKTGVPAPPVPSAGIHALRRALAWGGALALILTAAAGWIVANRPAKPAAGHIQRLAVLPLANLTGDPGQDYFAAGMHDALVAELSQIGALTVLSRQSVLRFQGSALPVPDIARELGVDGLVEGSVFVAGDTVRITVQVIRAHPEEHLWAGTRVGPLRSALMLQGEVAREVARAVRTRVAPEVERRLAEVRTVEPDAQRAYLRGLYHLERAVAAQALPFPERQEQHEAAIRSLLRAVEVDPGWAIAHARLAQAYLRLASLSRPPRSTELVALSKAAAARALELDQDEPLAHAKMAVILYQYEWDWAGADRAFERATALDPNSHHWLYARYLQAAGRHDDALAHFRKAEERNPLSDVLTWHVALALSCAGRHDEAVRKAEELEARMGGPVAATHQGLAVGIGTRPFIAYQRALGGRHDEAIHIMRENVILLDSLDAALIGLAYVYARGGRHDEARELVDLVEGRVAAVGGVFRPAQIYAALGETDRALTMVEEAFEANPPAFAGFRCSHTYRLLQHEPRMQAIIRRTGLPR